MANLSSYKKYPFALFLLFIVSSNLFVGISGVGNEQNISANRLTVINHEPCQSCPEKVSSLEILEKKPRFEAKFMPQGRKPDKFSNISKEGFEKVS